MAKKGINIYKRKDGRWEGRYKNGYTSNGKPKYSSVYGKSYTAVREQLEKRRAELMNNSVCRCSSTVGEIAENWLADIRNKIKGSTLANYTMKLNKHILPCYAGLKYERLTADDLNSFISKKVSEDLSEKYVSDIVSLLKSIARFAQKRYGCVNKIEYVTLPKNRECPERKLLSSAEQERLKTTLLNDPTNTNIGILLAAATGIRIGELCALKWENIDIEKNIITVRQTVQRIMKDGGGTCLTVTPPKSRTSSRDIPLPDFIVPYIKNIRTAGHCFMLSGNTKMIEPRTMQYRFKSILKRTGLPYINFHALRHMFATNCAAIGFDVKTLSEILGHSSVQITLNRYVHSSIERKKTYMKLFSENFCIAYSNSDLKM